MEKDEEHNAVTGQDHSNKGEEIMGEAIAADEEVQERTGGMLKGTEGQMVEAVNVTEEECN